MTRPLMQARSRVRTFDAAVDSAVNRLRGHPVADRAFYAASELGDFSLVWVMLGAARALRSDRDLQAALRLAVALTAESILVNALVKSVFRRSRPPWEVERPRRLRRPLTSSFPSGHATSSFTGAVLLSEDDPLWPLYWAVACMVAGSRVYVRIHHASDVVAGAALGMAMGVAIRRLAPLSPVEDPASAAGGGPGAPWGGPTPGTAEPAS